MPIDGEPVGPHSGTFFPKVAVVTYAGYLTFGGTMTQTHGIRFDQTQFWITHRRREYGPFDYDWSADLRGMELLYQGVKFGEICSAGEIFADMREFRLPMRVVEVASVVLGCIVLGVSSGFNEHERSALLVDTLVQFDCRSFLPRNS